MRGTSNLVPIAEIGPAIRELVEERWPHDYGYDVLAEKVGCDHSAIYSISRVEGECADFDLVDSIFCALGRVDMWTRGRFSDIYNAADLSQEKCRREGCNVRFVPRIGGRRGPGSRQLYCCRKCAHMQWKHDKGLVGHVRKRNLKTHCRNGHKRSEHKQIKGKGGYLMCATCANLSHRRGKARRTAEQIERDRAYQRAYYLRRKAAACN